MTGLQSRVALQELDWDLTHSDVRVPKVLLASFLCSRTETVAAVVAVLVPKPTYRASRVAFVVTIHRSTRSGSVRVTPVRTQTT